MEVQRESTKGKPLTAQEEASRASEVTSPLQQAWTIPRAA